MPQLKIKSLPVWLAAHREIRTGRRIRAVYDFLARNIPASIQTPRRIHNQRQEAS